MKFAHIIQGNSAEARLALIIGSTAYPCEKIMPHAPQSLQELIEGGEGETVRFSELRDTLTQNTESLNTNGLPLETVRFAPAIINAPHVLAVGANYSAHASELKLRSETALTVFSLWPNSLGAHNDVISWPESLSTQVDYEVELGVIIGKAAKNVPIHKALEHVWGYTIVNDITARDIQFREAQWSRCKSFDGFTPTGPFVVTADEIADPQDLQLVTNVNGRVLQDASSGEMVRSVAEIISELSHSATLLPGTLISTGSPGGAGYSRTPPVFLTDGSIVTVSIAGIGALTTHCRVT